jgi:hypothetical protein
VAVKSFDVMFVPPCGQVSASIGVELHALWKKELKAEVVSRIVSVFENEEKR